MDTIKLLFGITLALLAGGLAVSWKKYQREVAETPPGEMATVRREIAEIEAARELLRKERERLAASGVEEPAGEAVEPAELEEAGHQEIVELAAEDFPDTGTVFGEEVRSLREESEEKPLAEDRAEAIASAEPVAKVNDWVDSDEAGQFGSIEILDPEKVEKGVVLSLRRNSGILGRVVVVEVAEGEAIVDPLTVFTELKPAKGDELILDPR